MDQQKLRKYFRNMFGGGKVGPIEGEGDAPMQLAGMCLSIHSSERRNIEYGCPPGELAFLCDYMPAGMQHDKHGRETTIDPDEIPEEDSWILFPKSFHGVPVYWKRIHGIPVAG